MEVNPAAWRVFDMAGIKIDSLPLDKAYFGSIEIEKIYYGNIELYSAAEPPPSGYELRVANNYSDELTGSPYITTNNGNTYSLNNLSAGQLIEANVSSITYYGDGDYSNNYISYTMGGNARSAEPGETIVLTDNLYITYAVSSCLTGDTLVTMADYTTKRIDEIELGEAVLSFDWETMKLIPREVIYTDKDMGKTYTEYDVWTFDDGTVLKTVHPHEFYNVEHGHMTYMSNWTIGDHGYKIDGTRPKLISHDVVKEVVNHYKITLNGSTNFFANGLLNGDRNNPKNINL